MDFLPAEHPRPRHFILHLSDTHLLAGSDPLYGSVDSTAKLLLLFERLEAAERKPEAIVFTGDLTDKGEARAYDALRAIVEPAAAQMGAQVIWVMGNHDRRDTFKERLLDEPPDLAPMDRTYDVNGLRIITLDSTVPGYHHGELSDAQLTWLRDVLRTPAADGTILALHHPPVPSVQDLSVLVELRHQRDLAAAVEGTDVRAIIAGHLHYSTFSTFAGIPVSVASATCYTQDLATPGTRGQDAGQGFNMIHVYEDSVVHSVVPLDEQATVGERVDAAETRRRLDAAGIRIMDARTFSNA